MRIVCDENVPTAMYTILDQEGHDIVRVQDVLEIGDGDENIVAYSHEEDRRILTNDEDFFKLTHNGVLFLDSQTAPPRDVLVAIERIERQYNRAERRGEVVHIPDGWV